MRWLPVWGAALSLALVSGGCSYRMDSMFSRQSQNEADVESTGSIRPVAARPQMVAGLPDGDLAATRAAVSDALGKSGRDGSVPWEDVATGARGTVTPLSSAYSQDGTTCRDFLASYVRNGAESWLQGEACRSGGQGRWEVRQMRPWRRT